ncbi:MAG: phosphate ABC transporter substrate-binding protein, partial [Bacteroidales bacterium]|nr:phosphate ABC transporter substrate-binding protein [Bacteroidales bacterium]
VARSTESIHPYVRPYQYYIATADYPLLRSVYIINTDPRSSSMLRNFYFFVKGQKGQTIICNNSQLLPITPVQVKSVSVK